MQRPNPHQPMYSARTRVLLKIVSVMILTSLIVACGTRKPQVDRPPVLISPEAIEQEKIVTASGSANSSAAPGTVWEAPPFSLVIGNSYQAVTPEESNTNSGNRIRFELRNQEMVMSESDNQLGTTMVFRRSASSDQIVYGAVLGSGETGSGVVTILGPTSWQEARTVVGNTSAGAIRRSTTVEDDGSLVRRVFAFIDGQWIAQTIQFLAPVAGE